MVIKDDPQTFIMLGKISMAPMINPKSNMNEHGGIMIMPNKEGNALMWKKGFSEGKGPYHLKKMGPASNECEPSFHIFLLHYLSPKAPTSAYVQCQSFTH
jgi:hypothetical protein